MKETEKEFNGSASVINEMLKKHEMFSAKMKKNASTGQSAVSCTTPTRLKMPITETVSQWCEINIQMQY